ncbi:hypothetical protein [Microbulbifer sp. THAF38]|uniref:hypothetical protein n=1 Tax=Microbulbifer sp. THAF38 TaxID=2587856 RepID=UPI001267F8D9|nr:hypothetical protein [Microbulbifer sp. THAF38]QFT56423.1 hypothetical protein FIU95_17900 [Microbulbifer sp. THAF38]
MSSCKIFVESSKPVPESATRIFGEILTNNLETQETKLPVAVIESKQVIPSGCYIEILCSKTPHRTHKILQSMAIELDETARRLFQIEEPVGVRIQMVDEDFLLGVN